MTIDIEFVDIQLFDVRFFDDVADTSITLFAVHREQK